MRIETSKRFERNFKKIRNDDLRNKIRTVIEKLEKNPFDVSLNTHKLKGHLSGIWACKVTLDQRIIFEIDEDEKGLYISLLSLGKHEEVY